jgi:type III pantothenate kinase
VDPARKLWFDSHYETMDTLGADRWCAVIAAREEYGYPSIAIDCGTALTVNVIDPEGNFAGGNILPGISTSFETLNQRTAQLPDAKSAGVPPLIGTNTRDAIRAGILRTLVMGLEVLITAIESDYKARFKVILTGGDAALLSGIFEDLKHGSIKFPSPSGRGWGGVDPAWPIDPDLVLKGAVRYVEAES